MLATFRLILLVCWLIIAMPLTAILLFSGLEKARQRFVGVVFRVLAQIMGVRPVLSGEPSRERPLLIVSNHTSYLDIIAIGAVMQISFLPKSDIKGWPLVGWCCYLSGCVFVERKPGKLPKTRLAIHRALQKGRVICLFAEGTTNDGTHLHPFKSGFFSLAEDAPGLMVQPVSLQYISRNGKMLDEDGRRQVAWYGEDTQLLPHLFGLMGSNEITVAITCYEPLRAADFASRKLLCAACE